MNKRPAPAPLVPRMPKAKRVRTDTQKEYDATDRLRQAIALPGLDADYVFKVRSTSATALVVNQHTELNKLCLWKDVFGATDDFNPFAAPTDLWSMFVQITELLDSAEMRALAQPLVWTKDIAAHSWRQASEYWAAPEEDHLEYAHECVRLGDWRALAAMCMHFYCLFAIAAPVGSDYLARHRTGMLDRYRTSYDRDMVTAPEEWDVRERFLADPSRGPRACTHAPLDYEDFLRRAGEFTRLCHYIM